MGVEAFIEDAQRLRQIFATQISTIAEVRDPVGGYIFCQGINHLVDPALIDNAAQITKELFLNTLPTALYPEKVIGVPNRGKEFAYALSSANGLWNGISERVAAKNGSDPGIHAHYDEQTDTITIEGVRSFTKPGQVFDHIIRGIKPGDKVLVADDFSATGEATGQYLKAFGQLGISAVFAYMIAKDFSDTNPIQQGYRRSKENGLPVFAVAILTEIKDGKVKVSTDDIKL